jgi:hypothetical protein
MQTEYYCAVPGLIWAGPHPDWFRGRRAAAELFGTVRPHYVVDLSGQGDYLSGLSHLFGEDTVPGLIEFPIRDYRLPDSPNALRELLERIAGYAASGKRTYIHCAAGRGRTGLVVGCLLQVLGMVESGDEALDRVQELFDTTERAKEERRRGAALISPETPRQCDFVRDWRNV